MFKSAKIINDRLKENNFWINTRTSINQKSKDCFFIDMKIPFFSLNSKYEDKTLISYITKLNPDENIIKILEGFVNEKWDETLDIALQDNNFRRDLTYIYILYFINLTYEFCNARKYNEDEIAELSKANFFTRFFNHNGSLNLTSNSLSYESKSYLIKIFIEVHNSITRIYNFNIHSNRIKNYLEFVIRGESNKNVRSFDLKTKNELTEYINNSRLVDFEQDTINDKDFEFQLEDKHLNTLVTEEEEFTKFN